MGEFQIISGWWRHQPGQRVVGGVTAHSQELRKTGKCNISLFTEKQLEL